MHRSMVGTLMYLIVLREKAYLSQTRRQLQLQQQCMLSIPGFVAFVCLLPFFHVGSRSHCRILEDYFSLPLLDSSLNEALEPKHNCVLRHY